MARMTHGQTGLWEYWRMRNTTAVCCPIPYAGVRKPSCYDPPDLMALHSATSDRMGRLYSSFCAKGGIKAMQLLKHSCYHAGHGSTHCKKYNEANGTPIQAGSVTGAQKACCHVIQKDLARLEERRRRSFSRVFRRSHQCLEAQ